jgi:hypothetical protein
MPVGWKRLVTTGAGMIAAALTTAPAAWAVCHVAVCDTKYPGTVEEFMATPRVVEAADQVTALSKKDFTVSAYSFMDDSEALDLRIFYVDGVTRYSERRSKAKTVITYVSGKDRCARTVSSRYPNTFDADRKAPWTCSKRLRTDMSGAQWLLGYLPSQELAPRLADVQWFADITEDPEYAEFVNKYGVDLYVLIASRVGPAGNRFFVDYAFGPSAMVYSVSEDNSVGTAGSWFSLDASAKVPALPRMSRFHRA